MFAKISVDQALIKAKRHIKKRRDTRGSKVISINFSGFPKK